LSDKFKIDLAIAGLSPNRDLLKIGADPNWNTAASLASAASPISILGSDTLRASTASAISIGSNSLSASTAGPISILGSNPLSASASGPISFLQPSQHSESATLWADTARLNTDIFVAGKPYAFAGIEDNTALFKSAFSVTDTQQLFAIGAVDPSRGLSLSTFPGAQKDVSSVIASGAAYSSLFVLPKLADIASLTLQSATASTSPLGLAFTVGTPALQLAMNSMTKPWLSVENPHESVVAFAQIQGIGKLFSERSPFDASFGSVLRSSLGDWRDAIDWRGRAFQNPVVRSEFYLARGVDPTLTRFPIDAFEESAELARIVEPDDESVAEDDVARNVSAYAKFLRFEISMRQFIETTMKEVFGSNWMRHQMPNGMLEGWELKRTKALNAGQDERPLIEYADFTDYLRIIEKRDNWDRVFRPVFRRVEDVRESLQRLVPVRHATAHSRIITLDDELFLTIEIKRVLKAIRTASN
jgi:hypothetical protein